MTDSIADDGLAGHTVYFPRWCYLPPEEALNCTLTNSERVSNVSTRPRSKEYCAYYADASITRRRLSSITSMGYSTPKQYRETGC